MLKKENYPQKLCANMMQIRSPLKSISLNLLNNLNFSTKKKSQAKKKCDLLLTSTRKEGKSKIDDNLNFELGNNDLSYIFEELNKKENENMTVKSYELLTKKRKRSFITIDSLNKKNNYIKYLNRNKKNTKSRGLNDEPKLKIKVLTYNILNPGCMKKENEKDLTTDERMNKIKKDIIDLSPDVFCLQEADFYIYKNYLLKEDMNKYEILYGINCGSSFINIIGFKKQKYILKSFKNFSLANLGKYSGNRGIMNINLEFNNDNNIQIKKTNKIISIYNVHFPWKYENDRIILLNKIFWHIKETYNKGEDKKIFIMGDFNSEPSSKLIKLFYYNKFLKEEAKNCNKDINEKEKKIKIDLNTLYLSEEIYNKYHFNSAYQCYSKKIKNNGDFMRHPSFTSRTKYFKKTIDYIFFSNNLTIRKIAKLPYDYEVEKDKFLPSKDFPSDHLRLFAEFYL